MANAIKIFEKGTPERERLEQGAKMLTIASPNGTVYTVEDIYFDFGQNWMWTTIIANTSKGDSYQALSPREQEDLLFSEDVFEGLHKVTNGHSWTTYCVSTR